MLAELCPRLHLVTFSCGFSLPSAAWGPMTAMLTDRFLGENLCSAKDKAVFQRRLGQEAESANQEASDSSGPQLLGGPWDASACPGSPQPLASTIPFQGASTLRLGQHHLSEKHIVLCPGPGAMSSFKDQDHDSGCLDRTWQVSVLEMATLPAWSISHQTLSARSFCTPCSCPSSKQCRHLGFFQPAKPT